MSAPLPKINGTAIRTNCEPYRNTRSGTYGKGIDKVWDVLGEADNCITTKGILTGLTNIPMPDERLTAAVQLCGGIVRLEWTGAKEISYCVRVIIFQWLGKDDMKEVKETTGFEAPGWINETATWADRVLADPEGNTTTSPYNNNSGGELRILYDSRAELSSKDSHTSESRRVLDLDIQIPLKDCVLNFGTNTSGDRATGAIGMMAFSSCPNGTALCPSLTFGSRFHYKEIL